MYWIALAIAVAVKRVHPDLTYGAGALHRLDVPDMQAEAPNGTVTMLKQIASEYSRWSGSLATAGSVDSLGIVAAVAIDHSAQSIAIKFASVDPNAVTIWMRSFALVDPPRPESSQAAKPATFETLLHSYVSAQSHIPNHAPYEHISAQVEAILSPFPDSQSLAKVHRSFADEYKEIRKTLYPRLSQLRSQFPLYHFSFVGHSVGGAVAVLAAADFVHSSTTSQAQLSLAKNVSVVTFGQPRIGNAAFGDFISSLQISNVIRVVNYGDSVPHYGLQSWGFRHVGKQYWINSIQQLVSCDEEWHNGEDTNCMNQLVAAGPLFAHKKYFGFVMKVDPFYEAEL
ncbi:hypothetical protein HDU81_004334 [Chytriomyces hyalinus]|nr:hypothetical protein HDU81_004334 [Chytriomyces hyalinus]